MSADKTSNFSWVQDEGSKRVPILLNEKKNSTSPLSSKPSQSPFGRKRDKSSSISTQPDCRARQLLRIPSDIVLSCIPSPCPFLIKALKWLSCTEFNTADMLAEITLTSYCPQSLEFGTDRRPNSSTLWPQQSEVLISRIAGNQTVMKVVKNEERDGVT